MIYVRHGTGPEYTVLAISGTERGEIEAVAHHLGITLRASRGPLGPIERGTDMDYLDGGFWPWRQQSFFPRDLRNQRHATIDAIRYNERDGSPTLQIEPPAVSESKPWMNAMAADLFAMLRGRYLEGSIGENAIANAREILTITSNWSTAAAGDALTLLVITVPRYLTSHDMSHYFRRFGVGWDNEKSFYDAAQAAKQEVIRSPLDTALEIWLGIARQFASRGWTRQLPAFSLEPAPERAHVVWLVDGTCERVLSYLGEPDMSLDELRDLIAQQPPEGYTLRRVLSTSSAFKVVYLARDPRGRDVVLKRYKWGPKEMDDLAKRLATSPDRMIEKDTLTDWMGAVRHPHIQPCMLIRNPRGVPFILEPRLERTLDDPSVKSQPDLARMLRGVFEAVAYLHDERVVHTDIKPDNIGIRNGEAILLDFGIATVETTATKANPGSIKTRAPELFGSEVVPSTASDVWALGATVMAVVSGGDYPLLSREELKGLPPAHDPARQAIEERILARIEAYGSNPHALEEHIIRAFPSRAMPLCELALRACRIQPGQRSTCRELLALLG